MKQGRRDRSYEIVESERKKTRRKALFPFSSKFLLSLSFSLSNWSTEIRTRGRSDDSMRALWRYPLHCHGLIYSRSQEFDLEVYLLVASLKVDQGKFRFILCAVSHNAAIDHRSTRKIYRGNLSSSWKPTCWNEGNIRNSRDKSIHLPRKSSGFAGVVYCIA